MTKCDTCGGRGLLVDPMMAVYLYRARPQKCPNCEGTGKLVFETRFKPYLRFSRT